MKALAPIRAALGIRTVFNLLGPLTNPAAPRFRLIGAYDATTAELMAGTLGRHGHRARLGGARRGGLGRGDAHRSVLGIRGDGAAPFSAIEIDPRDFGLAACRSQRSGRRRRRGQSRGFARGVRRPRPRRTSCRPGAAMRPGAVHRRPRGVHRERHRYGARAAVDSGRARTVAGSGCGSLRQTRLSRERLPGRHGALERGARGAGAVARIARALWRGARDAAPPARRCACRRRGLRRHRGAQIAFPGRRRLGERRARIGWGASRRTPAAAPRPCRC